jgi:alkylation response protein AidB-like acyl-CoA dehydrogenase
MDFTLTDDQQLLRETARKLLDRECPPSVVRAHIDDPAAYEPLWTHLSEYTALGLGPATDLCLFLEETGKVAAPGPFLATALFASLTGEEATGTVAIPGASGAWEPNADPIKTFVLEADRVDRIAIIGAGPTLSVIDAPQASALRFVKTVDFSRRIFDLDTDAVALNPQPLPPKDLAAWLDRSYVSLAAEMVGTARRIFTMTLEYAKERKQFDVPIGSFQAIQHKLAEMSLALERATAAVHYAAMSVDEDDTTRARACHVAKAAAGVAARRILKDGIQIHGGIGYTWEHDLHLFLRRATADEYLLGPTGWHHDRLADLLIDGAD